MRFNCNDETEPYFLNLLTIRKCTLVCGHKRV
jgi:hypothetical protein